MVWIFPSSPDSFRNIPSLPYIYLNFLIANRSKKIRRCGKKLSKLFEGSPWSVALIIDSTLHNRSSHQVQNTQSFNHGSGLRFGHQWRNIFLFFEGFLIPLPPIEFLTKKECKRTKVEYTTENDRIVNILMD